MKAERRIYLLVMENDKVNKSILSGISVLELTSVLTAVEYSEKSF